MQGEFVKATIQDYYKWLDGFLKRGGQPTHFYDRPFEQGQRGASASFLLAKSTNFRLEGERGAKSASIIVPKGFRSDPRSDFGHCELLEMDGFRVIALGTATVSVYNDQLFLDDRRLREFIGSQSQSPGHGHPRH